jgi:hypothetical protein
MGEAVGRLAGEKPDEFSEDDGDEPGLAVVDPVASRNAGEFTADERGRPGNGDGELTGEAAGFGVDDENDEADAIFGDDEGKEPAREPPGGEEEDDCWNDMVDG